MSARRAAARGLLAVGASLVLHALGVLAFMASPALRALHEAPPAEAVAELEVETRFDSSPSKLAQADPATPSALALAPKAPTAAAPLRPAKMKMPSGQVVAVEPGNDQKPDDPRYLAEHDNRVAKETQARKTTPLYERAAPRQTTDRVLEARDLPNQMEGNRGRGNAESVESESTRATARELPKAAAEQEGEGLGSTPAHGAAQAATASESTPPQPTNVTANEGATPPAQPKVAALEGSTPQIAVPGGESPKTLDGSADRARGDRGAVATADHAGSEGKVGTPNASEHHSLAGVKGRPGAAPNDALTAQLSDGTSLNTREFIYAAFFNRLKQEVVEQWHPGDAMRDSGGGPPNLSARSRVTVLDVAIDDAGHLARVTVTQSCGYGFLDAESIAAIKRAAPFAKPPVALLDGDRRVHFLFDFHIDSGRHRFGSR